MVAVSLKSKADPDTESFMSDFHSMTAAHPWAWHLSVLDNYACLEIKPFDGKILFGYITTLERGKGHGTKALRWLTDLADKHNVELVGHIERKGDEGLTTNQLRQWYKRHGFKVDRQLRIVRPRKEQEKKHSPKSKSISDTIPI
jgi:hypothetical protein